MKKILIKCLLLSSSIIFVTSSASALTCTNLTKPLSKGSENSEVIKLQQFLFDGGYLTTKPNGYFGTGTMKGVQKFQGVNGLSQAGSVGPATRSKIKEMSCGGSLIKGNKTTPAVSTTLTQPTTVVNTAQSNKSLCGKYETSSTHKTLDDSYSSSGYLAKISGANFCSTGTIRPINSSLYCKDSNCFYTWTCSNVNSIKTKEEFVESECQSDIFAKSKNPTGDVIPDLVTITSIENKNLKSGDTIKLHGHGFLPKDIWENSGNFDHVAVMFLKSEPSVSSFVDEIDKRFISKESLNGVSNKSDTDFSFVLSDQMVQSLKNSPSAGNKYKLVIQFSGRDFSYISNKIDFTLSSANINKPAVTFKVDHSQVKSGERVGTTWTSTNVKSCHGIGVKTGGDLNGSYPSDPILSDTVLGNSCIGIDGVTVEATATVKVIN